MAGWFPLFAAPTGFNGGRSQTNFTFLGGGDWPFLNLLKEAPAWTVQDGSSNVVTPDILDSNGYPTSIVHGGVKVTFEIPTQVERPGNYCVTWDGTGTVVAGGGGAQLGSTSFTGSISGTTLTVSALTGTIAPGQLVAGSGVATYTIITAQLTGSAGAAGTYSVSVSQTLGSRAMTSSGGSNSSSGAANAGFYSCTMSGSTFFFQITAIGGSSDYISNVKIFHVDDAVKLLVNGEVFGAKFKERLVEANFGVLRFLNYQLGNTTNVTNWASRKPTGYFSYKSFELRNTLYCTTSATRSGTAYSATGPSGFALADKAMVHMHFTDSYTATQATFTNGVATVGIASHGLAVNARLFLSTSGTLPTNFALATKYFVVSVPDANSVTLSATQGGGAITAGSAGSGTHYANPFLTLNISGSGAVDMLGDYSNWLSIDSNTYPIGSTYQSLATLVYDASLNAWIKYNLIEGSAPGAIGLENGVPPELLVQLCEEVGAHPYFIAPPLACDPLTDYIPSLATYCRDNGPSWMIPRFEGPNELWNTHVGFLQTAYAQAKATAYSVSDPTNWIATDFHNWYGKAMSVIGQAVSTVYSNDRSKYHIIAGVQTSTMLPTGDRDNSIPRLSSASYVAQTSGAQSPYTRSAASDWVTHVACAQYMAPGLYATTVANGTPNESDLATAYAGGDLTAPGTYVDSLTAYPAYGVASDFTLPRLALLYASCKTFAQNAGIQKMCGYAGGYSPDYTGNATINSLKGAGKNVAALQTHTITNFDSFTALTGGGFTAEFPSTFLMGGTGGAWPILDPNIYVTTSPPQWLALIDFND
jgi:hypothetical protein